MSKVILSELIDALESQSDESQVYLNKNTGELIYLTEEDIQAVEDNVPLDDYPEWQQETIEKARIIFGTSSGIFLQLPGKWDLHEYDIMENFTHTVENLELADNLNNAIRGKGAFRRFKDTIHEYGIQDHWYTYRGNALREIAIDWCREQNIEYIDKTNK